MTMIRPVLIIGCVSLLAACAPDTENAETSSAADGAGAAVTNVENSAADGSAADGNGSAATTSPSADTVQLSADNAEIQFIGTHTGDEPKPRVGVFTEFTGEARLGADNQLEAVTVDIQTDSLVTAFDKLTNHLKSPDFFETREYPTARFESTSINSGEGGSNEKLIIGNLTLLDTTKEISFPVEVESGNGEFKLNGELTLNRSEFGMDYGMDSVHDEVTLNVAIGKPTEVPEKQEN